MFKTHQTDWQKAAGAGLLPRQGAVGDPSTGGTEKNPEKCERGHKVLVTGATNTPLGAAGKGMSQEQAEKSHRCSRAKLETGSGLDHLPGLSFNGALWPR